MGLCGSRWTTTGAVVRLLYIMWKIACSVYGGRWNHDYAALRPLDILWNVTTEPEGNLKLGPPACDQARIWNGRIRIALSFCTGPIASLKAQKSELLSFEQCGVDRSRRTWLKHHTTMTCLPKWTWRPSSTLIYKMSATSAEEYRWFDSSQGAWKRQSQRHKQRTKHGTRQKNQRQQCLLHTHPGRSSLYTRPYKPSNTTRPTASRDNIRDNSTSKRTVLRYATLITQPHSPHFLSP